MITKQRNASYTTGDTEYLWWIKPKSSSFTSAVGSLSAQRTYDALFEELNTNSGRNGRMRPCYHHRRRIDRVYYTRGEDFLPEPITGPVSNAQVAPGEFVSTLHGVRYIEDAVANHQTVYLDESTWRTYDTEALSVMLPSMVQGVSTVNFLLELKDFKDILKSREGWKKTLKKLRSQLSKQDKVKSFSEIVSKTVLFSEFAVRPFISDIADIYKGLFTIRERMRELESRQGKFQRRHYRRTLNGYDEEETFLRQYIPATWYKSPQTHGIKYESYRTYLVVPTYHATVAYRYKLDNWGGISELDAILDTLGVRLDPSIIWNAVPFTFMVDWFVNVSSFLERFATDNVGINVEIDDFCSSVKSIVRYDERVTHYFNQSGYPTQFGETETLCSGTHLTYERKTPIPNIYSALRTSGLSGREAGLTAALFGAGAFKRK